MRARWIKTWLAAGLLAASAAQGEAAQNAQLPQDIQVDRFILRAEQAIERADFAAARSALDSALELEESEARLPANFHFLQAKLSFQDGLYAQSLESLKRYLVLAERGSERYREALALLDQAELLAFSDSRTCLGKSEGAQCWIELSNHAGCHVWDFNFKEGSTVSWSGGCEDGTAHGEGTLSWEWPGRERSGTGPLVEGRKRGSWREQYADGTVARGAYSPAGRHDQWVIDLANGARATGIYKHGSVVRDWSEREPIEFKGKHLGWWTGSGPYVDDRKYGYWSWVGSGRSYEDDEREGPYVNGRRHGLWLYRDRHRGYPPKGGWVSKGPFVDGKKHGIWTEEDNEGPYVEGKRHGRWVERFVNRERRGSDGFFYLDPNQEGGDGSWVKSGEYVDGKKHGTWTRKDADGFRVSGEYVDGKREGKWTLSTNESSEEKWYVNGKQHGPYYYRYYIEHSNRYEAWEGEYVDGKRHGEWVLRSGRRISPGSGSIVGRRTYDNGTVVRCRGRYC